MENQEAFIYSVKDENYYAADRSKYEDLLGKRFKIYKGKDLGDKLFKYAFFGRNDEYLFDLTRYEGDVVVIRYALEEKSYIAVTTRNYG